MKNTLKVMLLGLLATTMLATSAFAEWVYVTKAGEKYHHADSRYAQMEGIERLSKEEAEELGYEPSKAYERMAKRAAEEKEKK